MDVNQLYTDIILEYNNDKTNKREIACPTISEHGHNANCGDDIQQIRKVAGRLQFYRCAKVLNK